MEINIHRLSEEAVVPSNAYHGDAGFDLVSVESVEISPKETRKVKTGIIIEIPEGYGGFILPRSGMSVNNHITIPNSPGLIDSGYRGEVLVALHNNSEKRYEVNAGDRIAQMVIMQVSQTNFNEVSIEKISDTERSTGGFGSSGGS